MAIPKEVFDSSGAPRALGEPVNEGGEGYVVALEKPNDHVVVKIYKPEKLNRLGKLLKEKVYIQISYKDRFANTNIAWPQMNVYNRDGH